ncbi:MAG: hypothetical protein ABJA98_08285 [Acidobacteriota bacterium]
MLASGVAWAQGSGEPLPGRYELAAGVSWTAPVPLGSADASLTNPSGGRYRLFSASTEIAGAPAFDARLGRRLTRAIQVELGASYSSPTLRSSISNDAENGAATVASESIRQITITGAAVFYVTRWRIASRILPFVTGGGGYLRQLHQGDTLAETGRTYFAGAGGTIPLGSQRRADGGNRLGIRADVRALFQTGGVSLGAQRRVSPSVTASAFVRF